MVTKKRYVMELRNAAKDGVSAKVKLLLEKGVDMNASGKVYLCLQLFHVQIALLLKYDVHNLPVRLHTAASCC